MSDRYNSRIARIVGQLNGYGDGYAVTVSASCTLYSVSESEVTEQWRKHEDCHKRQIAELGWVKFMAEYARESSRNGYYNNRFEIEARAAEKGVT